MSGACTPHSFKGQPSSFSCSVTTRSLILSGDFLEIDGSLYSAQEYYEGRRVHIHDQNVLRKGFNAYPLSRFHHSATEISLVLEFMNNLERAMAMFKEFQIPRTE